MASSRQRTRSQHYGELVIEEMAVPLSGGELVDVSSVVSVTGLAVGLVVDGTSGPVVGDADPGDVIFVDVIFVDVIFVDVVVVGVVVWAS